MSSCLIHATSILSSKREDKTSLTRNYLNGRERRLLTWMQSTAVAKTKKIPVKSNAPPKVKESTKLNTASKPTSAKHTTVSKSASKQAKQQENKGDQCSRSRTVVQYGRISNIEAARRESKKNRRTAAMIKRGKSIRYNRVIGGNVLGTSTPPLFITDGGQPAALPIDYSILQPAHGEMLVKRVPVLQYCNCGLNNRK
ncbi:hypothetical protein BDQ12DRAFT_669093 [Crucibulum laeve]|uniref:Uncharacterized protein n=1 Tax=Crucibulum laeve TaxID=68775 RepID=A0A5C3LQP7_9AGAR|nr:hypothetical protein BDQ12DRAFT_669093 [Crucibulum laeve]